MKKVLLIACAFLGVAEAAGPTANITWSAPTQYVDNSPLPASDIAYYTILWDSNSQKVNAPALTAVVNVPCGSTNFTVTITTSATAKYPNTTSDPTTPVPYATGVTCRPKPVTGVTVS